LNRSLTYGIDWNAQGKVGFIGREEGSDKYTLVFHYDGMGNRVRKVVVPRNEFGETLPIPEWTFTRPREAAPRAYYSEPSPVPNSI
jgi:hypothetical protein